jgi:deoxyribonuclease IV
VTAPSIGCHLSLGAKPDVSLEHAARHGVECVQVFASSPAAWKPPIVDESRDNLTNGVRKVLGVDPLFIHAIYLINLASEDRTLTQRSQKSLVATLEAGERLHARGVIVHPGSHLGRGFEDVVAEVGANILHVLRDAPVGVELILENSAGSGGTIGSSLEELAAVLDHAQGHSALKIALDTAHLCGAGWDFTQVEMPSLLAQRIRDTVGFDRLAALHANDSKLPLGSRRDRHASVGEGFIGLDGFRLLLREPEFRTIPWICETPDLGSTDHDERFGSVRRLHELRSEVQTTSGVRKRDRAAVVVHRDGYPEPRRNQ